MQYQEVAAKTILNPTSGFLKDGFTHTINIYRGCPLGNALCGVFCYAQWNEYHTLGRPWGSFLDSKTGYLEAYRRDYDRIRASRAHAGKPLKIYMSSVTDPYPPQERSTRRTRALLDEMLARPPDLLVIQSHTPNVLEDLDRLLTLAKRCRLEINLSVETDLDPMPAGFPRHMYPPRERIAALAALRAAGLTTVGVVSPLLPLADVEAFARDLESACERVILDHYLVGDGSVNGLRTRRSRLPQLLSDAGFARWTRLDALRDVEAVFRRVFRDDERVRISRSGFNRTEIEPIVAAPRLF